jgi:hypothetical protein
VQLNFVASSADYVQSKHWPFGTWGCARGYFQNLGLSNTSIQIWFTGPDGVERAVIDVVNLDTRQFKVAVAGGYNRYYWDNYANRNQTATKTTQTTFRYEDNVHIRAGAPVSCSQIGFGVVSAGGGTGGGGANVSPAAPTGLQVR